MNTSKVELMQAFSWLCPNCSKRNFEKAIGMEMDEEREKRLKSEISDCDAWVDLIGGFFMAPSKVTCKFCKEVFEVDQEVSRGEDNNDDTN